VYLAGQVPDTADADITQQTKEVLAQIDRVLALAGSDKSRLLSATIYLRDMSDYQGMNAVWDQWLAGHHAPARACVQAQMANPQWRVEIMSTAAVSNSS
jgi:enamine deaminase RidA (YjgF/YER057c/UK114 family)